MSRLIDLERISKEHATELLDVVKSAVGSERFCLGYHLRSLLDHDSPYVTVLDGSATSTSEAAALAKRHQKRRFRTLNHVLDALHFSAPRAEGTLENCVVLRLTFAMGNEESCHDFDQDSAMTGDGTTSFAVWRSRGLQEEGRTLRPIGTAKANGADRPGVTPNLLYGRFGVKWAGVRDRIATEVGSEASAEDLLADPRTLLDGFVCGAQHLCERLVLTRSLVHYRSLAASVYQLGEYTDKWGLHVVVLCRRAGGPFGIAHGLTVISDEMLETKHLEALLAVMERQALPKSSEPGPVPSSALAIEDSPTVVLRVAERLAAEVCRRGDGGIGAAMQRAMRQFLGEVVKFCDVKLEGRPICFGVVLGNARLLQHWPGPEPLRLDALARASDKGAEAPRSHQLVSNLSKYVHLLEEGVPLVVGS